MSKALGVRLRSVERWDSGSHAIPDDLALPLFKLLDDRSKKLKEMVWELEDETGYSPEAG